MRRKRKDTVEIINDQNKISGTVELKKTVRQAVTGVLDSEKITADCSVSVRFVDNPEIHRLNKEFRNIDRETDVLSFPSGEEIGDGRECFLGDIAISLEKAKAQSEEYGHSLLREVAFLTAHSVLHLLGYDHEDKNEETEMFKKQEEVLKNLGITRG